MRRSGILILIFVAGLLAGVACAFTLRDHPRVTSLNLGNDTADALTAFHSCKLIATWPVQLKPNQSLTLEHRICPVGFRADDFDKDWPGGIHHEVLLLESRSWWQTKIVSALFSDLNFSTIDVGKTHEGNDAVLWNYFIKCGSCHGGHEGILAWSASTSTYEWNADWADKFTAILDSKLPAGTYRDDTTPALSWVEPQKQQLNYTEAVYNPADPHCCPTAGSIDANFDITEGNLVPAGEPTFLAKQ